MRVGSNLPRAVPIAVPLTVQVRPLDCQDPFINMKNMKTSLLPTAFQSAEACFGFAMCGVTRSSTTCLGCKEQATAKNDLANQENAENEN